MTNPDLSLSSKQIRAFQCHALGTVLEMLLVLQPDTQTADAEGSWGLGMQLLWMLPWDASLCLRGPDMVPTQQQPARKARGSTRSCFHWRNMRTKHIPTFIQLYALTFWLRSSSLEDFQWVLNRIIAHMPIWQTESEVPKLMCTSDTFKEKEKHLWQAFQN